MLQPYHPFLLLRITLLTQHCSNNIGVLQQSSQVSILNSNVSRTTMPTQSKFTKYFKLLGLPRTATEADVKSAYKVLARSYHPDKVSQHETQEANRYMADLNEAYNTLINDCMPNRSALKHRYPSQEDPSDFQRSQSGQGEFSKPQEPPSEKRRQESDLDTSEGTPGPNIADAKGKVLVGNTPLDIDVCQIRVELSEMSKHRLIEHFRQTGLSPSDLGLRQKDSKVDNIIHATSQKVRALLLEKYCPLSELQNHVEQLCQPELTAKWARNSKTACMKELVDVYGYDQVRVAKWTHWQMVNALVKVSTQPGAVSAAIPAPTLDQRTTLSIPNPTSTASTPTTNPPPASTQQLHYHPRSHPELLHYQTYGLPDSTKSHATLEHEQSTIALSHATNLTLSSASNLLTLQKNSFDAALAHHSQLCVAKNTEHLIYLPLDQQMIMQLSRETGLTAEWAGKCLKGHGYDYEASKKRFHDDESAGRMDSNCLVPSGNLIGWIEQQEKNEDLMDM